MEYIIIAVREHASPGTHVPYGVAQCYLLSCRGAFPLLPQLIKAVTRFCNPFKDVFKEDTRLCSRAIQFETVMLFVRRAALQ